MMDLPKVSIIIPCFNEEKTIHLVLQSILQQDFDVSEVEVIIADGRSTDGTRERIREFQAQHPELAIQIVDNEKRDIPSGLNTALKAAKGSFIIRLDAHCMPRNDYIRLCVEGLEGGLGDNVGGVWEIQPSDEGWMAHAIAAAAAHPLGVGDAKYRIGKKPGMVDTVPFGAFRKEVFEKVGFFDENLKTNEDYEFNARLRLNGGKIWLDPRIRSVYIARGNFCDLWRQYWRYGFWKWRMLKNYPRTLRWRQALPPVFVFSLLILTALSIFWYFALWFLAAELALYFSILGFAGIVSAIKKRKFSLIFGLPLSIATMHIAWGAGFLWSMVKP